jgi:hypothetical protein
VPGNKAAATGLAASLRVVVWVSSTNRKRSDTQSPRPAGFKDFNRENEANCFGQSLKVVVTQAPS